MIVTSHYNWWVKLRIWLFGLRSAGDWTVAYRCNVCSYGVTLYVPNKDPKNKPCTKWNSTGPDRWLCTKCGADKTHQVQWVGRLWMVGRWPIWEWLPEESLPEDLRPKSLGVRVEETMAAVEDTLRSSTTKPKKK